MIVDLDFHFDTNINSIDLILIRNLTMSYCYLCSKV